MVLSYEAGFSASLATRGRSNFADRTIIKRVRILDARRLPGLLAHLP